MYPSRIRFLKNSKLDLTLGFGCSVLVETSPGEWENFRSFYAELYLKLKVELNSNDATKLIKLDGDLEELKAVRIKIFNKNQQMVAEETTITMMLNMGLNMLKSQAANALDIPSISYPTIKECTGLTLLRPAVVIYDGYIVVSTDLEVKAAEKDCDITTPPEGYEDFASTMQDAEREYVEDKEDEVWKEDL